MNYTNHLFSIELNYFNVKVKSTALDLIPLWKFQMLNGLLTAAQAWPVQYDNWTSFVFFQLP